MIVHHPTHVLETMGDLEHTLIDAATPMLAAFEQIRDCLRTQKVFGQVPHALTKDFPTLLFAYLHALHAWKVRLSSNFLRMRVLLAY
jgi:hypothetical protein